jgi:hypothetical protein
MFDLLNSLTINAQAVGDVVAGPGSGGRTGSVWVNAVAGAAEIQMHGTPAEIGDLGRKITAAAEALRVNMRDRIIAEWADAHPEEAAPLNHGGQCTGCGVIAGQLYGYRTRTDDGVEVHDSCAECANVPVDQAEALTNAVRLTIDETPNHRRAELHDAGLDAVAGF